MLVEGRSLVTRERTTESMDKPPLQSSYVKYEENMSMVPDPVLRGYLKVDLTYQDFRDMACAWQKKKVHGETSIHPAGSLLLL